MNDKAMATKVSEIPEPPSSGWVARVKQWFDEEHEERKLEDKCRGFGWAMSEFSIREKGIQVLHKQARKARESSVLLPFDMGVEYAIDYLRRSEEFNAASDTIAKWLSAALDDPNVCDEMKGSLNIWFNAFNAHKFP